MMERFWEWTWDHPTLWHLVVVPLVTVVIVAALYAPFFLIFRLTA